MWDFYDNFYRATKTSEAHKLFCTRVFGLDLCQHGFADVDQLDALIAAVGIHPKNVLRISKGLYRLRKGAFASNLDDTLITFGKA